MRPGARPRRALASLAAGALAAVATVAAPLGAPTGIAFAGPAEARTRWKEARALGASAPWRARALAYRAARTEAAETDPMRARAAAAEAKALRDGECPEAATALDALAASLGPARDEDRVGRSLDLGRRLAADEDAVGARPWLEDVVENGASSPRNAAMALDLLARFAADERDGAALARLVADAQSIAPREYATRLLLLDRLGLFRLSTGDARAARRLAAEERRLYSESQRKDDIAARAAAKAWLRLQLPARLDEG